MTEEKEFVQETESKGVKRYLPFLPIAVFLLCIAAGTYLGGDGGAVIHLENPFAGDESFFFICARICFLDVLQVLLIGVGAGQRLYVPAATVIGALRGTALGAAVTFCTGNALPAAAVGMTISFGAVSALLLCYGTFMNRIASETGFLYRILCYFAVSGAAALLHLLPYILL